MTGMVRMLIFHQSMGQSEIFYLKRQEKIIVFGSTLTFGSNN